MSSDKNDGLGELSGWAERLEAGAADEPTLKLAAQLQKQRPPAPEPPAEFTAELRRQLLDQYGRRPAFNLQGLGRLVGTAVALSILAIAVLATWLAMAQRPGTATDPQNTVTVTRRGAEVIYDRFRVSLTTAEGDFVEGTAEFWQSGDGRLFRGQMVDDSGNVQVVVVTDGHNVVYGTRAEPPGGKLRYTTIEILPDETASHAAMSTLYETLGWEGIVEAMIQPDWDCADYSCVINQVAHPAPTNPEDVTEQGCDGYSSSITGTETRPDGRSIDVIRISYGCYSVTHEADSPPAEPEIPPSSEYLLPQYRLIEVDGESFELLEVTDYDGDTILRSIRQIERQWLSAAELPDGFFSAAPDVATAVNPDTIAVTGTITTAVGITNDQISIRLGNALELISYELSETDQGLEVTLYWHARQQPTADYTVSIGLMDENSNLVSEANDQIGGHSHPTSSWATDENVHEAYTLPIPAYAPEGRYELFVFVVDPQSGTRLPVRTNNEHILVFDGLIWLTDWLVESKIKETATATSARDRIWISSITQHGRNAKDAPITFEVVVGYELVSVPEAVIKLHYAAPDWETRQVDGRVPIDGMSEFVPITADENNVIFEFTGSPQEMAQVVGTENPVPVIQLGNFVEHDDGRGRELQLYAVETFANYPFSLVTTEEIRYAGEAETSATVESPAPDSVEVVSVTPGPETTITGTTTFEVQLGYNLASLPDAVITVTIAEKLGSAGGRGVANNRMSIQRGQGQVTILVPFNPAGELSSQADLALMVQMQPDERAAPVAIEMPEVYQWRYEP